jgi:hypothetical protein
MPTHILVKMEAGEYLGLGDAFEKRSHEVQDILYEAILSVALPTRVLSLLRVVSIFRDRLKQNESLTTVAEEKVECVLNACRRGANLGSVEERFFNYGKELAVVALYIATTYNSTLFNDIIDFGPEDQVKLIHSVIQLPQKPHIATFVNDLKKLPLFDIRPPLQFSRPRGRQKGKSTTSTVFYLLIVFIEKQHLIPRPANIHSEESQIPQPMNQPSVSSRPTNPSNPNKRKRLTSQEQPHQVDSRLLPWIDAELVPERTLPPLLPVRHLNTASLYKNLQNLPVSGNRSRPPQEGLVTEQPSLRHAPHTLEQMARPDTQPAKQQGLFLVTERPSSQEVLQASDTQAANQPELSMWQYIDGRRDENSWGEQQFRLPSEYIDQANNFSGEESQFNIPLEQMVRPDKQAGSQPELSMWQYIDGRRDENSWGEQQFRLPSEYIDQVNNSLGEESQFNIPLEQMMRPDKQAGSQPELSMGQYIDGRRDENSWGEQQFRPPLEYIDG